MMTLEQGVELVWHAFDDMEVAEDLRQQDSIDEVVDIARAVAPNAAHDIIGTRPGEKLDMSRW